MITAYFDGLCEPDNPGGVECYGFLIKNQGMLIHEGWGKNNEGPGATNNVAEYVALGKALRWISDSLEPKEDIEIIGDSKLVVSQINKAWACRAPHLIKLRDRCFELITEIEVKFKVKITFKWVPREGNEEADALSNKAYEEATGQKVIPRDKKKKAYARWSRRN